MFFGKKTKRFLNRFLIIDKMELMSFHERSKISLEEIVNKLNQAFSPVSVVLYGSRARTDFLERSDYEIGLFCSQDNPVIWEDVKKVVNEKGINIYPFVYEDFLKGDFDTPFQKTIYKRELIVAGKTLSGENIQGLIPPKIKILILLKM